MTIHAHATRLDSPQGGLQAGRWVRCGDRTGIVGLCHGDGTAEIHFVDDQGRTVVVAPAIPLSELRLARHKEIPEARRPGFETLIGLGYLP